MFKVGLTLFSDCIKTMLFGEVCDTCDGKAIYAILAAVIKIFTGLIGIVAVIGIVVAGITYLKSGGDPAKHNKARSRLINIGLGLIVYVLAFTITEFLLPGGIVNHKLSNVEELSCPEITYTDTTITRPENPGNASGGANPGGSDAPKKPSPYAGTTPKVTIAEDTYNGKKYNYIEVKNGTPYVYAPTKRDIFPTVLKNIKQTTEANNVTIIANAGEFNMTNYEPLGITIQNGKKISDKTPRQWYYVLVIDEDGNIGYIDRKAPFHAQDLIDGKGSYIDAISGETVSGKKIISAVTGFGPFFTQGKVNNSFVWPSHYKDKRARQILCVKSDKTVVLITNRLEQASGGWKYSDMGEVVKQRGCTTAFNMDGGGSTATAWRKDTNSTFSIYTSTGRHDPTFTVFTSDNLPPGAKESDYEPDNAPDRSSLIGKKPSIKVQKYSFKNTDGNNSSYTVIIAKNAIPYTFSYNYGTKLPTVVSNIKKTNILTISNGAFPKGPKVANSKPVETNLGHNVRYKAISLVVDEKGNVGYGPGKVSSAEFITGKSTYIDAVTGKTVKNRKMVSVITAFGYFYLNGKENWTFGKPTNNRSRQIFCAQADNTYLIITQAHDGKWGWDYKDMVTAVKKHNCVSAYNLDGGQSTGTAYRTSAKASFSTNYYSGSHSLDRGLGLYVTFTSDNRVPK